MGNSCMAGKYQALINGKGGDAFLCEESRYQNITIILSIIFRRSKSLIQYERT